MDNFFRVLEIGAPFIIMINAIIMIAPDVIEDYKNWKMKKDDPERIREVDERKEIQKKWKEV